MAGTRLVFLDEQCKAVSVAETTGLLPGSYEVGVLPYLSIGLGSVVENYRIVRHEGDTICLQYEPLPQGIIIKEMPEMREGDQISDEDQGDFD